jgi:N-acetylneuraminic acid mutarotase
MKSFFTLFIAILFVTSAGFSQSYQWQWKKGSNSINATGVYGSINVENAAYTPGSRTWPCTWNTATHAYVFGGLGFNNSSNTGMLNDLWRYNFATNNWAYIKGSTSLDDLANYGTINVEVASNKPGARYSSTSFMVGTNLYMFGGLGVIQNGIYYYNPGALNDVWRFNTTTNNWTWLAGDNNGNILGVYGTQGVENAANKPGGRAGASSWTDKDGNLWVFGGNGCSASQTFVYLNDLWKFNTVTNNWAWMGGSDGGNQLPVYGAKGVEAAANWPGALEDSYHWKDTAGNFWLMGGRAYSALGEGIMNDLWKFNPVTGYWTWVSGNATPSTNGVYGTLQQPAPTNMPGGRFGGKGWADSRNKFWIFGGFGRDKATGYGADLNDLWFYDPLTNLWTWVKGSDTKSQAGVYGTINVPSAVNTPGSRYYTSGFIRAATNSLYLFGGWSDANNFNDLWTISAEGPLPVKLSAFTASLQRYNTVNCAWTTSSELNVQSFTVQHSTNNLDFKDVGIVNPKGSGGMGAAYIFEHSTPIAGKNYYRIKALDNDGSFSYSPVKVLTVFKTKATMNVVIYPGRLILHISGSEKGETLISIIGADGKMVLSKPMQLQEGSNVISLQTVLIAGTYIVNNTGINGSVSQKILVK